MLAWVFPSTANRQHILNASRGEVFTCRWSSEPIYMCTLFSAVIDNSSKLQGMWFIWLSTKIIINIRVHTASSRYNDRTHKIVNIYLNVMVFRIILVHRDTKFISSSGLCGSIKLGNL